MKTLIKKILHTFGLEISKLKKGRHNNEWLFENKFNILIDIGASEGKFSLLFLKNNPLLTVFAFEPIPESFLKLQMNLKDFENVKFYNLALSATGGITKFYLNSHHTSSSILKMATLHKEAFPESGKEKQIEATKKRLDDIIDTNLLRSKLVLIKIDVQGYESQVIDGGKQVISNADTIIVEIIFDSLYEDQKLFDLVYNQIKDLGFVYKGNLSQIYNPNDGKVLQANAIFTKG